MLELEKEITIRREKEEDYRIVENLTREAFWNVYCPGCKEHFVLHRMRSDSAFVPELDFLIERNHEIVGQIAYVRSEIICSNGSRLPVLTFGPISIAKEYQKRGYGTYLLNYSAKAKGIRYADDLEADYLLVKELIPGFLNGVQGIYKDPECYFSAEKNPDEFAAFDALFPLKEKKKIPGQIFGS